MGYDQLLEDPEVEAVYIPLANQLHVEWCVKAAKKGKHILCEKPLAPTAAELETVFSACQENQVKIMEAFPYVHGAVLNRVREIIGSGEIGAVLNVDGTFFTPRHPISNVRMRRETLGGGIYDLGCYNVSLAVEIFREMPQAVTACATMTAQNIDDYSTIVMDFGEGRRAVSTCGMILRPGHRRMHYTIYGEKGFIDVADSGYNIPGNIPVRVCTETQDRTEVVASFDNYALEVEQFGRCITEDAPYRFTHAESRLTAKILDIALKEIGYYP